MINQNVNRSSVTISAPDLTAINGGFNAIDTGLDAYSQALTMDERKNLLGGADKNQLFANDALKQGQTLIAELPPNVQNIVNNLATDTDFLQQLDKIMKTQVLPLLTRIKDTRRVVVHERYVQALAIYKIIATGAELALPGYAPAYDILKAYFAGRGRRKIEETI